MGFELEFNFSFRSLKKLIPMKDLKKLGGRNVSLIQAERMTTLKVTSATLPVNILDKLKILKDNYKEQRRKESDEDGEDYYDDDEESERMSDFERHRLEKGDECNFKKIGFEE